MNTFVFERPFGNKPTHLGHVTYYDHGISKTKNTDLVICCSDVGIASSASDESWVRKLGETGEWSG
jgi:hypothetical protein